MKLLLPFFLLSTLSAFAADATVTESFTQSYPISATGAIRLENVNGSVEIVGWDKNEVSVEAVKSAPTAEDLARIHLKIEATPDRLSIKTEHEKKMFLFGTWRGEVRYVVHVPATVTLEEISVINAEIHARDVKGRTYLKTVNGRIEATGLAAAGRFETVNGSISITFTSLTGVDALSLRTVNGRCDLTLPKGSAFDVNSTSINGGVHTDTPIKVEKSNLAHFRGGVGEGGPKIDFTSVNGELSIHEK